jgi:hypothetical protein
VAYVVQLIGLLQTDAVVAAETVLRAVIVLGLHGIGRY